MTLTKEKINEVLKTVEDPELSMDVITLGLIYGITIEKKNVKIEMTYTTPMCPFGPAMKQEIIDKVNKLEKGTKTTIELTFDPPWQPSEEVKTMLGIS